MTTDRRPRTSTARRSRQRLRAQFIERLDEQLDEVRSLLEAAEADAALREAASEMLTRLSRTASSLGLAAVAAAAYRAEQGAPLEEVVDAVARTAVRGLARGVTLAPIALFVSRDLPEWVRRCDQLAVPMVVFDDVDNLLGELERSQLQAVIVPERLLRKVVRRSGDAPVLAVGAAGDLEARLRAVRAGAAAYLEEPLELERAQRRALQLSPPADAPRVLVVGDDAAQVVDALKTDGIQARVSGTAHDVLADLDAFQPGLLIVRAPVGDLDASELVGVVRTHRRWANLPVMALAPEAMEPALSAMRTDDRLDPDVDLDQVVRLARLRIGQFLLRGAAGLWEPGRGVSTRLATLDVLDSALATARRGGPSVSLALVGMHSARPLNARQTGRLEQVVAELLVRNTRRGDRIGRLDDQRLLLVMPGCTAEQAARRLSMLQLELPTAIGAASTGFTFVAGVVDSKDGTVGILRRADEALAAARVEGSGQVVVR